MISALARLAVAACLLLAAWTVFNQFNARQTSLYVSGIEGVLGALWWDPTRAKYHVRAGRYFRDDLERMDLPRAIRHLERAVELNPYRGFSWFDLGQAYERAALVDEAEKAYLAAVACERPAPRFRWVLSNFYLRQGRRDDALVHMREALAEEPDYMPMALAVLVRGGTRLGELATVWPPGTEPGMRLLELAAGWRAAGRGGIEHSEITALWDRLLASDPPPTIEDGDPFVAHLFESGRHAEARRAWVALTARNGQVDAAFADGANDVWDGGFEHPLSVSTLAWYAWPGDGFEIALAPGEGRDGGTALRIDFDGRHNAKLGHVQQRVLLEPGLTYEIEFEARTDGVTTEEGPRLEVLDRRNQRVLYRSQGIVGTTDWDTYSGSFTVPDDCGSAFVRVVRLSSRRIANRIDGRFWLDHVRLRPVRRD